MSERMIMTSIFGVDPRTGAGLDPAVTATAASEVATLAERARSAAPALAGMKRAARAAMLGQIGDAIESNRLELVEIADRETGFGEAKLNAELTRAVFQFRFFGDVVREGSYLEAAIDPPAETPMGPRPDLRRMLVPIGPVAVFCASNFPFAFSVLGGDTASALAAGSPVVLKAHESHPGTAQMSYLILSESLEKHGLPRSACAIVHGVDGGTALVAHPAIKAVGFTGSLAGGMALLDVIATRDEPIPFYGELSSLNPVVVTPGAAAQRGPDIGAGLAASFTLGSGQLCTKPGFVLVPQGPDGDRVVEAARESMNQVGRRVLLNEKIFANYRRETAEIEDRAGVLVYAAAADGDTGFAVTPRLAEIAFDELDFASVHEVFGPITLVARYRADSVVHCAAAMFDRLPDSLTATLFTAADEDSVDELTVLARAHAGRVIFDDFPTGVAVSWAQHHGGPWPSTNSVHTSVGATAIRRFLRPITYQNALQRVLPDELRDDYTAIPRRMNGVLELATDSSM